MPSSASSWRELVPGLIAATVIAAVVWIVLRYAQVGALHGDTMKLVAPVAVQIFHRRERHPHHLP